MSLKRAKTTSGTAHARYSRDCDGAFGFVDQRRSGRTAGDEVASMTGSPEAVEADIKLVVSAMQDATNAVLKIAESLLASSATGSAYRAEAERRLFELMEICSYQDLAGQRLTRLGDAFRTMTERLELLSSVAGPNAGTALAGTGETRKLAWKQHNLVHGPSNADAANQDTVDELLSRSG